MVNYFASTSYQLTFSLNVVFIYFNDFNFYFKAMVSTLFAGKQK